MDGDIVSIIFKGVHYEISIMANGYEWLVHTTKMYPVGTHVAHYTLKSYDVVFDAGEGKMTGADSLKAEHGYTLALSDYVAEPSDSDLYSFVGWKSGSTDHAADANVAVTQPLTFTARYEMNFTPAEMFEFSQTEEEGKVKLSGLADGFDGERKSVV